MFTKFAPRPLSFSLTFLSPPLFLPKPAIVSLLSTYATTSLSTTIFGQTFSYGPSLYKGHQPSAEHKLQVEEDDDDDYLFDEDSFTRVFDIAALRVPSDRCFCLESRIRGHLLNWPRIGNIARVPGDEIEDEFKGFLKLHDDSNSKDDSLASLNRRIYGKAEGDGEPLTPILYRDKLARTFNSRGYANFRNLAKLSRPKKRKEKEERETREKNNGIVRNKLSLVVDQSEQEGEDLSGLLGDEFKGRKWKGSTRLLLLDERYANKSMEEMPEAIKVPACSKT